MIEVDKLLKAIKDRCKIWTFHDVYPTKLAAKRAAAELFVTETGAVVRQTGPKTYIVLSWHPGFND